MSRYVSNPLLIGGKKFDLRVYVVVTRFRPLRAYISRLGFARFCNVKYSSAPDDLENPYVHLTNVAVQRKHREYNHKHGNKWSLANLRLYLDAARGAKATDAMFASINEAIAHSLRSVQNAVVNDRRCFEVYGYDMLVDDDLKPWLVEVNASPSLSATTESDRALKTRVIRDALEVAAPAGWLEARQAEFEAKRAEMAAVMEAEQKALEAVREEARLAGEERTRLREEEQAKADGELKALEEQQKKENAHKAKAG